MALLPSRPPLSGPSLAVSPASYWRVSRAPRHSLLLALPLLLLYELLAAVLSRPDGGGVRNAADVLVKVPFVALFGVRGPVVFAALVIVACVGLVWRDVRRARGGVRGRVLALMLAESTALAVVCGLVVGIATTQLLGALGGSVLVAPGAFLAAQGGSIADAGLATRVMLSLGAGLYEELVFRVLLVSALAVGARRLLGASTFVAGAFAVVVGALSFAGVHHVGAYGDPFTVQAFTFRTIAGLFFSALYVLRGFGITAWTHAIYDLMVLVV